MVLYNHQSAKNGISRTIEAKYAPIIGKYVASGYFGGDKNYVPGTLSVAYNVEPVKITDMTEAEKAGTAKITVKSGSKKYVITVKVKK